MRVPILLWLSLAMSSLADPAPPPLTFLYAVNLTFNGAGTLNIGQTAMGRRVAYPISGGTFSGPLMSGVALYGLDWGLTDNRGVFREDTIYYLYTNDSAVIMVRAIGIGRNVHHTFETSAAKYMWLNNVVAFAGSRSVVGAVGLDVWQTNGTRAGG
ncbi:hypothetical protein B0T19DRAFT_399959 [Cercophora scortea]|uniref:Dirigent protein n=1 Tax=Cercophora scortea TaxID=314031 RepID=A0AAE0IMF7_9PEZI|nr:hypothetical protein B0T19DRAFT_399959 [Cercophora scortea]